MEKAVYRIMDANFNRAREGLRVMEEYCRFVLNNPLLSGRAKQLRHQLCRSLETIDQGRLICSRDSQNDVGKELGVQGQLKRYTIEDCFTAAARRLTEALRAMAEVSQTLDEKLYLVFEKLRFEVYSLEKEILAFAFGYIRFRKVRLYILITVTNQSEQIKSLDLVKACISGGADCIQLRSKGIPDKEFMLLGDQFSQCCRDGYVLSIVNDRPDIALLTNTDGIHLGQNDISVSRFRVLQNRPMITGLSTHNAIQLSEAMSLPVDYVGLGPVYSTLTKQSEPVAGLDYIAHAMTILKDSNIGHAAIGGITLDNVGQILSLGVRAVAVCSVISQSDNPEKTCRKFKDTILKY